MAKAKKQPEDVPSFSLGLETSDVPTDVGVSDIPAPQAFTFPPGFAPEPEVVPGEESFAFPEGFTPDEESAPSVAQDIVSRTGTKIKERFMGTDVEDPIMFTRLGAQVAGAAAGGILGSRTPVAPGPLGFAVNPFTGGLVGSGLGTLIGTIAPETTMEAGEALGFLPEGFRAEFGLSPSDLRVVAEGEILLDVATGGGFAIARTVARPTFSFLAGVTKSDKKLAGELGAKFDIQLMPVQLGHRSVARGFVAVMGRFPIIGGPIVKRGQAAELATQKAFLEAGSRIAPLRDMPEISETIFRDARNTVFEVNKLFGDLYDDVWEQARNLNVQVIPRETVAKAEDILKRLRVRKGITPTGEEIPGVGPILDKVEDFINVNILPRKQGNVIAKQSFESMDALASQLDQFMTTLEPSQQKYAQSLMNELRQAIQADAVINVRGPNADVIASQMRQLDSDFSFTMSQLFETATAKRFGSVRKRGLRAVEFDAATRIEIDELARVLIKLDSPQAMGEIAELVTPETYRAITAKIIDDAVQDSFTPGAGFNVNTFVKKLGLEKGESGRRRAVSEMLERSGNSLTMEDLDLLVHAGRVIESLEIPNVSTFIARRATIGGIQSLINGLVPGLGLAAGASGAGAAVGSSIFGIATFVGGGRLMANILSNPGTSKMLRDAIQEEAALVFGKGISPSARKAWTAIIRAGVMSMFAEGDISAEKTGELIQITEDTIRAYDRQIAEMFTGQQEENK